MYTNCTDDIAQLHRKIKAAAENYSATVNNIAHDDQNRASKIAAAKEEMNKRIAKYNIEIKKLTTSCGETYETDMEECNDAFAECTDV